VFEGCEQGWQDCNQNEDDGCEVNTNDDPENCGGCDNACELEHATAACHQGSCVVSECEDGYGDCDGNPATGCEVDIGVSMDHCGSCGADCALDHATAACHDGSCQVEECDDGWQDCNGDDVDGCETNLATDTQHCGTCRKRCGAGQVCSDGTCECPDEDGDTHGVPPCGDDCDDSDADVFPGQEEACDDEVDNDCDGDTDEGCEKEPDDTKTEGGGCGCGAGGTGAAGRAFLGWLGLLGLILSWRRVRA
jgi:MYXO-CTERM domain-containing protein